MSQIYLLSGKVSSKSEMGHVPTFDILVQLTWNDYTVKWGWLGPIFGIFHDLLPHLASTAKWSFESPGKIQNSCKMQIYFLKQWVTHIMGMLAHSWLKIMKFSQFFIIPTFWHLKVKVVKFQSKKGQYFLMNYLHRRIKFNFL